MDEDYDYIFKILLLGNSGVGKSSLLIRFSDNAYDELFSTTIGIDFKMKTIKLENDKNVKLQCWDTSGQEKFRSITNSYYRGTNGIILVYDVTSKDSFDNLKTWLEEIKDKTDNISILLVGNKVDLNTKREVLYEEGKEFADLLNINFFETSAKENINTEKIFLKLAENIRENAIINNNLESLIKKSRIKNVLPPQSTNLFACGDACGGRNSSCC